ncbi:MAG: EAL domain-containing protein, partial [Moraxellaceae bacterium]
AQHHQGRRFDQGVQDQPVARSEEHGAREVASHGDAHGEAAKQHGDDHAATAAPAKHGEAMSDEEIAKLAEEFVADDATEVKSAGHAVVKNEHGEAAHGAASVAKEEVAAPKTRTLEKAEPLSAAKNIASGRSVSAVATEEKKIEEFIHHQAYHDLLTGLPNRNFLLEKIDSIIRENPEKDKKIAVIFIDLDNFKKVNDTEGHEAGDKLLRTAAKRMRKCVREGDILARLGGDEFLILIESAISQSGLTRMCSNILETLAQPFLLNNRNHFISCSMGISIYPRDDTVPDGLIGKADMAMYRAKKLGKNNFQFYSEELERLALHQLEFEHNLRLAIINEHITIYLQPEINLSTGKIVSVEALVRWIKPDGSMIPPVQFISVAEQANLIGEIGRIVLDKVCVELARWKTHGIDNITVAINLSAREFNDNELAKNIQAKLLVHGIAGEKIVLEITESLFMEDKENVLKTMNQLRAVGIRFAIDDFGTGYSSFSYLQDLPIDYLKIDRSFLLGATKNKKKYAIARSIIDIGNHLDLKVIAEGIEDQDTLDFIIENCCTMAQGFFMYSPMPVDDLFHLLIKQK